MLNVSVLQRNGINTQSMYWSKGGKSSNWRLPAKTTLGSLSKPISAGSGLFTGPTRNNVLSGNRKGDFFEQWIVNAQFVEIADEANDLAGVVFEFRGARVFFSQNFLKN